MADSVARILRAVAHGLRHPFESGRFVVKTLELAQATERAAGLLAPTDARRDGHRGAGNPLWDYFQSHRDGRGIWKWEHYFDVYERHLAKFVGRAPHVVEIGVYSGGSLDMWHRYFGDGCRVSGIDIEEACRAYAGDHTSIVIGDQGDRAFWARFRAETPPVDILIDDGGHLPEQQRVTLEEMLPHLRPGGVYLCEDVHGEGNAHAAYVHKLADRLNGVSWAPLADNEEGIGSDTSPLQRLLHSVHLYPFIVVIERAEHAGVSLRCPKHGTEWQPFL
jgi:SAM-dependent methyltransferase